MPDPRRLIVASLGGVLGATLLVGCASQARPTSGAAEAPVTASSSPASPTPTADPGAPAAAPARAVPPPPAPERLRIPALGLDERLIDLGIDAAGALEVPADPDRVGWFTGGGRPTGTGPTVLAGHVDSRTGPAVFAGLSDLSIGDRVEVVNAAGRTVVYEIDEIDEPAKETFPTAEVFGATSTDELRLITCRDWDAENATYAGNLVLHATAVG
ncbi:hypothetical protein GCM10027425_28770 [Alteromonas gracilis]